MMEHERLTREDLRALAAAMRAAFERPTAENLIRLAWMAGWLEDGYNGSESPEPKAAGRTDLPSSPLSFWRWI
jgi:hypothetical protein